MPELDLSRLLAPRSVVVVGATDRPGSYAATTLLNLRRAGYPGRVVGVHPRRRRVLGITCRPSLRAASELLPEASPDAIVIAVPAAAVEGYLAEAGRLGCGGAVVYAAGFGETGQGAAQLRLARTARRHGLAMLGPNANGLVAVGPRAPLWGDPVTLPDRPGPIAMITQSGNLGVLALAHRAGLGLHTVISLGNAAVLDAPAVLAHLARCGPESGLRAIALYLEDDGEGALLAEALAACARADIRVAVLKAGRSAAGRQAAGAHTAALAGDHRVFAALIEEAGGVAAHDLPDLIETARALAGGRRSAGGLAVLTASGGDAAIAADLAADAGVPLADLSAATTSRLAELIPGPTPLNPLDHTNQLWADTEAVAALTAVLAGDPGVGTLIYVQDEPPGLPAGDAAEWAATRAGAELGGHRAGVPAMLVASTPGQEPPLAISGLRPAMAAIGELRRPAPDPERLQAIAAAARRSASTARPRAGRSAGRVGARAQGARAQGTRAGWLAEHEAKSLLAEAGLVVPASRVLSLDDRSAAPELVAERAVRAARSLGFPVALKLSAPGLLHKSETGALALNLADTAEVRAAARRLLRLAPSLTASGTSSGTSSRASSRAAGGAGAVLLVERMAPPGPELVLAARQDGVVPALLVGLGGIWAELLDDVRILPLPADPERVVAALRLLRAAPVLTGGRGATPVDLEAIGQVGYRIGEMLLSGGFSLLEVNPLILGSAGPVAADALARRPGRSLS